MFQISNQSETLWLKRLFFYFDWQIMGYNHLFCWKTGHILHIHPWTKSNSTKLFSHRLYCTCDTAILQWVRTQSINHIHSLSQSPTHQPTSTHSQALIHSLTESINHIHWLTHIYLLNNSHLIGWLNDWSAKQKQATCGRKSWWTSQNNGSVLRKKNNVTASSSLSCFEEILFWRVLSQRSIENIQKICGILARDWVTQIDSLGDL